jgi:hypothetical protein
LGFDIGLEDAPVHGRIDDERRSERAAAQAGDESLRLPMPERSLGAQSLALQATSAQSRHLGGGSRLVQEDQPLRLKPHPRLPRQGPFLARLLDIGPILLTGQQFF